MGSAAAIVAGYITASYLFVQIVPQIMSVMVDVKAGEMVYIASNKLMAAAWNNSTG